MSLFDMLKRKATEVVNEAVDNGVKKAVDAASRKKKNVVFSKLPKNAAELKALPNFSLKDEFFVAAAAAVCLDVYPENREACFEMLNVLKGPQPLMTAEKQFINDRNMDGKHYVMRSYMKGSSPDNDYTPTQPYTIEVTELSNSRENEGYMKLYLESSGADSLRFVVLRNKPSTGEWFLWEFQGIMPDIRIPKSKDAWA